MREMWVPKRCQKRRLRDGRRQEGTDNWENMDHRGHVRGAEYDCGRTWVWRTWVLGDLAMDRTRATGTWAQGSRWVLEWVLKEGHSVEEDMDAGSRTKTIEWI